MKTLDDFKNEMLTQKYNGLKWEDLKFFLTTNDSRVSVSRLIYELEQMANDYAAFMCQQQKEIDFKHAKLKQIDSLHMCPQYVVDKYSILNAPLATDKNK